MLSAMSMFLVKMLIRVVVFGVAIGYVLRNSDGVKVTPRKALPLVALVFAVLNALLYPVLKFSLNLVTLWTLFFIVPLVANALLLKVTSRAVKQFQIDGLIPLAYASLVMSVTHFLLHLVRL